MQKLLLKISTAGRFVIATTLLHILTGTGIFGLGGISIAQPSMAWQRSLGGTENDQVNFGGGVSPRGHMAKTSDGGVVFAVPSFSNDGDVTGHHGTNLAADVWVVKMDSAGYIDWQKSLGGVLNDDPTSIIQTSDGGYIISAITNSTDGDVPNDSATINGGAWIIKLNATGNIQWTYVFGGSESDEILSIKQTTDGGFILCGHTSSSDGDAVGLHASLPWLTTNNDVWLLKLNSTGSIQWTKCLGGSKYDNGTYIEQTADHGFIIIGNTSSNDFDVTTNVDTSVFSAWIVKTDSMGNIQWEKTKGGLNNTFDFGYEIYQTYDGGYIVGIHTLTDPGPLQGDVQHPIGGGDMWVLKLNNAGDEQWQWCYGGTSLENFRSLKPAGNPGMPGSDGYILTGWTISSDSMVTNNYGGFGDIWVIKISTTGALQWQKSYGGSGRDEPSGIVHQNDGSIYVIGESTSNDHDVSGHHGPLTNQDIWLFKLNGAPTSIEEPHYSNAYLKVYPNPVSSKAIISFQLEKAEHVSMHIYNTLGQEIQNIYSGELPAGEKYLAWLPGVNIENGIYFVKIKGINFHGFEKLNVVR